MMSFISLLGASEHPIRWLEVLFDASVKSIVVLALAIGLNLALRRSSAAFRHLIWLLAVASCLCLPIISVTLPSWRLPVVVPQTLPLTEATPGLEGNLDQLPPPALQVESPTNRLRKWTPTANQRDCPTRLKRPLCLRKKQDGGPRLPFGPILALPGGLVC